MANNPYFFSFLVVWQDGVVLGVYLVRNRVSEATKQQVLIWLLERNLHGAWVKLLGEPDEEGLLERLANDMKEYV